MIMITNSFYFEFLQKSVSYLSVTCLFTLFTTQTLFSQSDFLNNSEKKARQILEKTIESSHRKFIGLKSLLNHPISSSLNQFFISHISSSISFFFFKTTSPVIGCLISSKAILPRNGLKFYQILTPLLITHLGLSIILRY